MTSEDTSENQEIVLCYELTTTDTVSCFSDVSVLAIQ